MSSTMLLFPDDIALLAENEKELKGVLNRMENVLSVKYRMKLNESKTKLMQCLKKNNASHMNVKKGTENIKEVQEFCYLESGNNQ